MQQQKKTHQKNSDDENFFLSEITFEDFIKQQKPESYIKHSKSRSRYTLISFVLGPRCFLCYLFKAWRQLLQKVYQEIFYVVIQILKSEKIYYLYTPLREKPNLLYIDPCFQNSCSFGNKNRFGSRVLRNVNLHLLEDLHRFFFFFSYPFVALKKEACMSYEQVNGSHTYGKLYMNI